MRKEIKYNTTIYVGWDSSVGMATRYGLDGPGYECVCVCVCVYIYIYI